MLSSLRSISLNSSGSTKYRSSLSTNRFNLNRSKSHLTQFHSNQLQGLSKLRSNVDTRVACYSLIKRNFNSTVEKTEDKSNDKEQVVGVIIPTDDVKKLEEEKQKKPKHPAIELLEAYAALSKVKLGSMVLVTTMVGYYMAPGPFIVSKFIWTCVGTGLSASSAHTFNQVIEAELDSKMSRTWNRVLPTGKISKKHASIFGIVTGVTGVMILYSNVNNVSCLLSLSTIILYTCLYTPLKQYHPINTLVGGVVGAIPPMIGWFARSINNDSSINNYNDYLSSLFNISDSSLLLSILSSSSSSSLSSSLSSLSSLSSSSPVAGAWLLGLLLYIWQVPHFHSLSWRLRDDYKKAGYKMLCTVNPDKLPRTCLIWSILLIPLGSLFYYYGITSYLFIIDSLLINLYLIYHSIRFYIDPSNINSRRLFFSTLFYLPTFLLLLLIHKLSNNDNDKDNDKDKIKESS